MELTISKKAGYVLAKTKGAVDDTAPDIFLRRLHPVAKQYDAMLILDLSGSDRINSMGIGALVSLVSEAGTSNCRVVLAGPTEFVAGALRVAKLETIFDIADDVDEAVGRLLGD